MTYDGRWDSENFKPVRKHGNTRGKQFRYCQRHAKIEPVSSRCFRPTPAHQKSAAVHVYKPFHNIVLDEKPILISSKAQHRRECAKRGLICNE